MDQRIARFRKIRQTVRQGRRSGAAPYPAEARAIALGLAQERGVGAKESITLARELGLAPQTLEVWLSKGRLEKEGLVPVHLVDDDGRPEDRGGAPSQPLSRPLPESRPVVVLPSGVRLEGLDLEAMVAVARALS